MSGVCKVTLEPEACHPDSWDRVPLPPPPPLSWTCTALPGVFEQSKWYAHYKKMLSFMLLEQVGAYDIRFSGIFYSLIN